MAPDAVRVCQQPWEARSAAKVTETFELLQQGVPVIAQPALWWAPEQIYGVPDVLIYTSWLASHLPSIGDSENQEERDPGHYVAFDLKFTTGLEKAKKADDLEIYSAQVRIYSYMLGQLQGLMPTEAYLVTRDRLSDPLAVPIRSSVGGPLDEDLAATRDWYLDIKLNGQDLTPWEHESVSSNLRHDDERWKTAKRTIAEEKTPGRDPCLLLRVTLPIRERLQDLGYPHLDSLLAADPSSIPFESCPGIGDSYARRMRGILTANRSGECHRPDEGLMQTVLPHEFYVDFEYFTNVNVDFETEWPTLEGCEMIFMVGVGWESDGEWSFRAFAADAESQQSELAMLEEFTQFLVDHAGADLTDGRKTALYHWTSAEVWQCRRASERHELAEEHVLCGLPWVDLQKTFVQGPCGIPGAWDYSLKPVANSLGSLLPEYDPKWPGDLDEGLKAMVMGWRAYGADDPHQSAEMAMLREYLEADCRALWLLLKWLRTTP